MSDEQSFLRAIQARPDDAVTRLVYADWLEERGDARHELIRVEEELRTTPIDTDRYWALKPRRAELCRPAEFPWREQLGYGGTDYRPAFADVPDGWRGRWRLIREYVERWYGVPMGDVEVPLKPFPPAGTGLLWEQDLPTVDAAVHNQAVTAKLPPSLQEWLRFIRDLRLARPGFDNGSGDGHVFWDRDGQLHFFQQAGNRSLFLVRDEDRHDPDPPVYHAEPWSERDPPTPVSLRVSTLAWLYVLTLESPDLGGPGEAPRKLTKKLARQLAGYFPVCSKWDGIEVFERDNVIAVHTPASPLTGRQPRLRVTVRPPADANRVREAIWR